MPKNELHHVINNDDRARIAWVTVTIPVDLNADVLDTMTPEQQRIAAIEVFLDHPAVKNPGDLRHYVDSIRFEEDTHPC